MVKITKRPEPPKKTITSENDYRSNPNFKTLADDCFNKCYICECKSSSLNVEHRIPHQGKNSLKYDWHNLFLSCDHCNNTKGVRYNNILDPSRCDPEDFIALSLTTDSWIEKVIVEALANDASTVQTVDLLEKVYNGEITAIKKAECANLRNAISENIYTFRQYIKNYNDEPDGQFRNFIKEKIKNEIARSSAFAAFKRKIIRDDADLSVTFAAALM
jgi:hypothetical protein